MSGDRPRVFLYQEHLDALRSRLGSQLTSVQADALGMALDGGEVFHVYLQPPQAHFAGRPCRAHVVVSESSPGAVPQPPDDAVEVVVMVEIRGDRLSGRGTVWRADGPVPADVTLVPVSADIYSRSKGLLETDALAGKSVAVVGLGSGGSTIAVALAQSGVGRLVLVDRDRLEVGNVARHACGIGDLGRRKTSAVADLIHGKNPALQVVTADVDIVREPEAAQEAIEGVDLLIAATDSDRSRFVLNQVALDNRIRAVFGRVLTRACGGEVLRVRPFEGPCLSCVYTERFLAQRPREYSSRSEAREDAPAYVGDDDLEATVQVGLASDIAPVSNLMVKLALVELSRGSAGGLDSLGDDLLADFYVWANRREKVYASWPKMGYQFSQPSILRWYGANLARREGCLSCAPVHNVSSSYFGAPEGVR
ncbi:HesA/MoeB/ThiF family protein [Nucisporomicrobium flavum]|uniref:HesA/MoeB/ThiF family protein n=1 Tax=Nucisporomicrobium flavum TaxID=2785915 RepID=UPI0018F3D4A1|nr:ThiF family adenylyltransferase [Nucisporomicrobium flavum]